MPGILNKFFSPCHQDKEAKLLQKIWAFLEKIYGLLFFHFYICGPFEGGSGSNASNAFPFNTTQLGYVKFNKCLLAAETLALIH